jgi:NADH-quinone oxidoreductase subunit H
MELLNNYYVLSGLKMAVVMGAFLTALAYLQLVERKVLAHIQWRLGPNRVGPHGIWQPIADTVKLLLKEDLNPPHVNQFYFLLAPFLAVMLAMIPVCLIPFGPQIEIFGIQTRMVLADINVGVLVVLAISSISVYGIALAGWSSNNKYSLLGGLRSSAQMISYELPLAMTIAAPLLIANTLNLSQVVESQAGYHFGFLPQWSIFAAPFPQLFSFILFLIAAFAETNRVPFDLPEAENELVAGFHTEYSSMKFASFFMAEYANIVTICSVATTLFLGGWTPLWPKEMGSDLAPTILLGLTGLVFLLRSGSPQFRSDKFTFPIAGILCLLLGAFFLLPALKPITIPVFWYVAKTGFLVFIFIWIRGTLPRFRYDQLMRFAWTFMFPVAVINLLITGLMVALFPNR